LTKTGKRNKREIIISADIPRLMKDGNQAVVVYFCKVARKESATSEAVAEDTCAKLMSLIFSCKELKSKDTLSLLHIPNR